MSLNHSLSVFTTLLLIENTMLDIEQELEEKPEVRELNAAQRRVLGRCLRKRLRLPSTIR